MKKWFAILVSIVLLSHMFNSMGIIIHYYSDIASYVEEFCKNKDKPEMHCNGKCHLKEELAQNTESQQNKEITNAPKITLFVEDYCNSIQPYTFKFDVKNAFIYKPLSSTPIHKSIFHPPQCV